MSEQIETRDTVPANAIEIAAMEVVTKLEPGETYVLRWNALAYLSHEEAMRGAHILREKFGLKTCFLTGEPIMLVRLEGKPHAD